MVGRLERCRRTAFLMKFTESKPFSDGFQQMNNNPAIVPDNHRAHIALSRLLVSILVMNSVQLHGGVTLIF